MDSQTLYSLKIFEKLGTPLMNAVLRAADQKDGSVSGDDAKQLAELLALAVKMSQKLSSNFDPKDPQDADALKLLLAANVSPIIAEHFAKNGKLLKNKDIERVEAIFERLISFTDGFAEAKDAANKRFRLSDVDALSVSDRLVFDDDQLVLQAMHAMLPVVIRISEYAFGREEKEFLGDVTKKIQSRAKLLAKSLYGKQDKSDQKLAELGIIRSLAHIYASCHNAEKLRIEKMDEAQRDKIIKDGLVPLDNLWSMFELRAGLMVALSQNLVDEAEVSEEPVLRAPVKEKAENTKSDDNKPAASSAGGNPMSFFSKPSQDSQVESDIADEEGEEEGGSRSGGGKDMFTPEKEDSAPAEQTNDNPMSFFSKKGAGGM